MSSNRITILHDSFGRRGDLRKDWGFAALVEFGGRRILFDAGNDARTFAENTDSLGVDLRSLDFAVGEVLDLLENETGMHSCLEPKPQASPVGAGGKRRHPRAHENTGIGEDE